MEQPLLRVTLLSEHARAPCRATEGSCGYDLFAAHETVLPARGHGLVPTDIAVAIPQGHYGRIASRSSLAMQGLDVGAGVVDSDYRGPLGIVMFNHTDRDFTVQRGRKVAQMLLETIITPPVAVVSVAELGVTTRGTGGFGSTDATPQ
eukprot:TRINITY_DN6788_c0_g1_i1.p2 TRINITY_DN6788_c0_g1~~TRINITY_DN6788_c0_g1_i1.p2  ORF type:complete len:169 (-),score=22.84 TRINITY_DN6788_c0_g1_i1:32-475(-)